jgi:hypothetical protein
MTMEEYWPKWEPTWPVSFSVGVKSKRQAETLACCLIRVERYLRRGIPKGDFKHWDLADRLALARRKLQEEAGLVAVLRWFALVHNGRIVQETYATDAGSALAQFKAIGGEPPSGSTVEKSTGKDQLE